MQLTCCQLSMCTHAHGTLYIATPLNASGLCVTVAAPATLLLAACGCSSTLACGVVFVLLHSML
jgi:hypothetical protein